MVGKLQYENGFWFSLWGEKREDERNEGGWLPTIDPKPYSHAENDPFAPPYISQSPNSKLIPLTQLNVTLDLGK